MCQRPAQGRLEENVPFDLPRLKQTHNVDIFIVQQSVNTDRLAKNVFVVYHVLNTFVYLSNKDLNRLSGTLFPFRPEELK